MHPSSRMKSSLSSSSPTTGDRVVRSRSVARPAFRGVGEGGTTGKTREDEMEGLCRGRDGRQRRSNDDDDHDDDDGGSGALASYLIRGVGVGGGGNVRNLVGRDKESEDAMISKESMVSEETPNIRNGKGRFNRSTITTGRAKSAGRGGMGGGYADNRDEEDVVATAKSDRGRQRMREDGPATARGGRGESKENREKKTKHAFFDAKVKKERKSSGSGSGSGNNNGTGGSDSDHVGEDSDKEVKKNRSKSLPKFWGWKSNGTPTKESSKKSSYKSKKNAEALPSRTKRKSDTKGSKKKNNTTLRESTVIVSACPPTSPNSRFPSSSRFRGEEGGTFISYGTNRASSVPRQRAATASSLLNYNRRTATSTIDATGAGGGNKVDDEDDFGEDFDDGEGDGSFISFLSAPTEVGAMAGTGRRARVASPRDLRSREHGGVLSAAAQAQARANARAAALTSATVAMGKGIGGTAGFHTSPVAMNAFGTGGLDGKMGGGDQVHHRTMDGRTSVTRVIHRVGLGGGIGKVVNVGTVMAGTGTGMTPSKKEEDCVRRRILLQNQHQHQNQPGVSKQINDASRNISTFTPRALTMGRQTTTTLAALESANEEVRDGSIGGFEGGHTGMTAPVTPAVGLVPVMSPLSYLSSFAHQQHQLQQQNQQQQHQHQQRWQDGMSSIPVATATLVDRVSAMALRNEEGNSINDMRDENPIAVPTYSPEQINTTSLNHGASVQGCAVMGNGSGIPKKFNTNLPNNCNDARADASSITIRGFAAATATVAAPVAAVMCMGERIEKAFGKIVPKCADGKVAMDGAGGEAGARAEAGAGGEADPGAYYDEMAEKKNESDNYGGAADSAATPYPLSSPYAPAYRGMESAPWPQQQQQPNQHNPTSQQYHQQFRPGQNGTPNHQPIVIGLDAQGTNVPHLTRGGVGIGSDGGAGGGWRHQSDLTSPSTPLLHTSTTTNNGHADDAWHKQQKRMLRDLAASERQATTRHRDQRQQQQQQQQHHQQHHQYMHPSSSPLSSPSNKATGGVGEGMVGVGTAAYELQERELNARAKKDAIRRRIQKLRMDQKMEEERRRRIEEGRGNRK